MQRFYVTPECCSGEVACLPDEVAHQLTRVLRLGAGARIVLFCGDGTEREAVIEEAGKRVTVRLLEPSRPQVELGCRLHVGVAVLKGEKLDWTVQKLTELGVSHISLLATERTVVSAGEERWAKRIERLRRIAREAVEQCGRVVLPQVDEPVRLAELLARDGDGPRYILAPGSGGHLLAQVAATPEAVTLLIGPEGGFSESEVARAVEAGARAVSLGARVLRAETAAITAAAVVAAAFDSRPE